MQLSSGSTPVAPKATQGVIRLPSGVRERKRELQDVSEGEYTLAYRTR